jgi:uncharacterized protein YkwD
MLRLYASLLVLSFILLGLLAPAAGDEPKTKPELTKDEKGIFDLANKEREKEKLPALELNQLLVKAARDHSANMAKKRELNHLLDDKNPGQRAEAAGYHWMSVAENIATGETETPATVVKLWMESKLHRENILNTEFRDIGVGIAKNDKGEIYYTQVFGTPLKK